MITYDYECTECDNRFEVLQSIKDDAFTVCPQCEQETLRRVLHAPLYVKVVGEPTTIGQLADRNSKKMSTEDMQEAQKRYQTAKTINRIPEDCRPATQKSAPTQETPEWMTKPRTKTSKEVAKLSPEAVKRYVQTGE
jgi:putative FmdB family regulatory protein